MAEERIARRLAAILAADVVGYSRMMGADEEGTLAAIKAIRRELLHPKVAEHHGRIVKTTGDGALVEFPSAVDAVRFALDAQRAAAERNANIPEDRRIAFRIGINVGDIISDEGDIYGDGVNIAARIEPLAEPGAICLSDNAYQQIKGKLSARRNRHGRAAAQEHRTAGARLWHSTRRRRRTPGAVAAGPAVDRGAAVPEHERRSGAGLFRRRHGRGHHHRPVAHQVAVRHRAQFDLHLQGPRRRREAGRPRARRALCARRQRAQGGGSRAHHRPAHRHRDPARMSGPSATTASPTIFSRCRTRSPSPSSAPSSRACVWPRPSASNASAPTASTPMILSCRRSPTSIRAIPARATNALVLLERALALDPTYALAHAYAAECHHTLFLRGGLREENRTARSATPRPP